MEWDDKEGPNRCFEICLPTKNWAVHGGIGAVPSSELAVNPAFICDRPGGKMGKEGTEG